MTTAILARPPRGRPETTPPDDELAPLLCNGDHMTQPEFHRAYEAMPAGFKAELIGGVVFVASSTSLDHAADHVSLGGLLFIYWARTRGVQAADNATLILGPRAEPQPDLFLRVLPEFGGRSTTSAPNQPSGTRFAQGPPELIIEVAYTSRAIDLHHKLDDYRTAGVPEYLVFLAADRRMRWFDLATDRELPIDTDGVVRVRQFPGLWIDTAALADGDGLRLIATLEAGLAGPGHAAFVRELAERNANRPQT